MPTWIPFGSAGALDSPEVAAGKHLRGRRDLRGGATSAQGDGLEDSQPTIGTWLTGVISLVLRFKPGIKKLSMASRFPASTT